ncbi:NAD(P)-dependent oxidoreductase [Bombilactobacillus bombi]|uniref:NAD(P)-dependent oxidoreductase n=1 Tax=Bombilactobacillus bombi TaxID=1303590 RepID=A0A3R6WBH7_9LACO|nr:NAD(P)H-binding protein [Bombilactobacillus bombi]RHW52054.1 NAD(P)-dependent oxidoreductase [Bombilactobacillus bombi]
MTKVLIIGATGSLGQVTRQYFLENSDDQLTLMARNLTPLQTQINPQREHLVAGDVTNSQQLQAALQGQDVVVAALSGDLPQMAQSLITQMNQMNIRRLIFISSMGIYNEIPAAIGEEGNLQHNPLLKNYRQAADIIEASSLNYTVIRPGWFDNGTDIHYQITKKGEPFGGHDVSRKSIADLILRLAHDSQLGSRESLGINRA